MTKVIGLTGGIGSGKSTACEIMAEHRIPIIDTDIISRQIVEPNSPALTEIVKHFGKEILQIDGSLNRALLRELIFNNPAKKTLLESLLHPIIQAETQRQIQTYQQQKPPLIVVAIPLLVEGIVKNGRPNYIDEIWVVDCSVEQQISRATQRDQNSVEQIKKIINLQATRAQRLNHADQVILNDGSQLELHRQINQLLAKYSA